MAIDVLREHGIDWAGRTPKGVDPIADQQFDLVLTVCDNAREACPFFPGARAQVHWGIPDPAEVEGDEERRRAFRETYEVLAGWVERLLKFPLESLDATALISRVQAIVGERGE
jgi:arsenate reductase